MGKKKTFKLKYKVEYTDNRKKKYQLFSNKGDANRFAEIRKLRYSKNVKVKKGNFGTFQI